MQPDIYERHRPLISMALALLLAVFQLMYAVGIVNAQSQSQSPLHVDVTIRNEIDPREVVFIDCMLNDASIEPKGFLTGESGSTEAAISEDLGPEDAIFCDFKLGFVPKDLIQVSVKCSADGRCLPLSIAFTRQGAFFNLETGSKPLGSPDASWSTLLPSSQH